MGDGLHYWDFPEDSDQYFWRRDKALHPGWDGDAIRNYRTYWKPLMDRVPEGPNLVTNTYNQDMENWDMSETAPRTVAPSLTLGETNTSLACERKDAGTTEHGDGNFTENPDVNHVKGNGCQETDEDTRMHGDGNFTENPDVNYVKGHGCEEIDEVPRTQAVGRITENPDDNIVKGYQVCEGREEDVRTLCEDSEIENPDVNHVKDYQACEGREEDARTLCEDSVTEKLDVDHMTDQSLLSPANHDGINTDSSAFGICMCAGF